MQKSIRLFVAIALPQQVKTALVETARQMGQHLPGEAVRWVKLEQLHLTLRFLGETAVPQLAILQDQLNQLGSNHPPFHLRLNGVGAFPNRKRPRVLWAGLGGALPLLQKMQADLEERVVKMGWVREKRPFNPHLTLGRVKNARLLPGLNWQVMLPEIDFGVTAVQLVQSELRPSGPIYTVIHSTTLDQTG